ncbi:hypothetical protein WMY93_030204 [Mugilogobius chulae]|uniref:Uncharacterized protein n=1 Tax=Mugilogobius chulae TaxID=88201 RepID=A0AAW0MQN2_9GOBI
MAKGSEVRKNHQSGMVHAGTNVHPGTETDESENKGGVTLQCLSSVRAKEVKSRRKEGREDTRSLAQGRVWGGLGRHRASNTAVLSHTFFAQDCPVSAGPPPAAPLMGL